jgi:hypothetical protein
MAATSKAGPGLFGLGIASCVSALTTLVYGIGGRRVRSPALTTTALLLGQAVLFLVMPDARVDINVGQC